MYVLFPTVITISLIFEFTQSSRKMLLKQGGGALSPFFCWILKWNELLPLLVENWISDDYTRFVDGFVDSFVENAGYVGYIGYVYVIDYMFTVDGMLGYMMVLKPNWLLWSINDYLSFCTASCPYSNFFFLIFSYALRTNC